MPISGRGPNDWPPRGHRSALFGVVPSAEEVLSPTSRSASGAPRDADGAETPGRDRGQLSRTLRQHVWPPLPGSGE